MRLYYPAMQLCLRITNVLIILFVIVCINAGSLAELVFHGNTDGALIESTLPGNEDEMRYLSKIREAAEGRWLMGNPTLKEHRDEAFSASGFVDWIPAVFLKALGMNMGLMLLVTDLLFTMLTVILTWLWLRRVIGNDVIVWCALLILFFSPLGGSLEGLLRDTVPKFIQPLASLYLLLLTLPGRSSIRHTLIRGILIGCMFYTYPYHWTLFLVTEGVMWLYNFRETFVRLLVFSNKPTNQQTKNILLHGFAFVLPFIILAAPLALTMRSMLSRPGFADFYTRYHIVYTHIPAAPRLQLIIVIALLVAAASMRFTAKKRDMLPLLLPLIAMLILLNANIITGKDPEWLGHGGRVIMPVVAALHGAVIAHLFPRKMTAVAGTVLLVFLVTLTSQRQILRAQTLHSNVVLWEQSPEKAVIDWLQDNLPPEQIVSAPRILSEKIPVYTTHYVSFGVAAHFSFVTLDELTDRYLGWVGLYPWEKEPTETATVIIFGNHPGAQWSKERTIAKLLGKPFTKTMADYIPRQDLRRQIDEEHAKPGDTLTVERLNKYNVDVLIAPPTTHMPEEIRRQLRLAHTIGQYDIWMR